jgi:hypothetical protein
LVDDEEGNNEDEDQEIHCLGDTTSSPHLTQGAYEESLISNQLDELCKGEKVNQDESQNKYNLRSKQKDGKPSASTHPKKTDTP